MRFVDVTLAAPPERLDALDAFYDHPIGETSLRFVPGTGEPFYHFALLVPGDRFDAALGWARARTELLEDGAVFDFDAWDARACYFEDPARNIVELIAHRGVDENGAHGAFSADELVGLSELGLVGDPAELYAPLERAGLVLWDGSLEGGLAFVGERARTFILAPAGRGWLPTGRPAESHPVDAEVELDGARYRVRAVASAGVHVARPRFSRYCWW